MAVGLLMAGCANATVGQPSSAATPATSASRSASSTQPPSSVPAYAHIFYLMLENHAYEEIIGNPAAPHINEFAQTYGLATSDWGVAHPSEPNYVASVGGSTFGIQDDASWKSAGHTLNAPYLGSQLEQAGRTWKTYQQALPSDNAAKQRDVYAADGSLLYATKHNPFLNFLGRYPQSQWSAELDKMVPDTQLATDLQANTVPDFAYIVPDQCHDMHGTTSCQSNDSLIAAGDQYVNTVVRQILAAQVWQHGNNAIIVTWDENDYNSTPGAPGIASDGGHVATIVITNNGPRHVQYGAPANHYALLRTIQDALHLECLQNSCPATGHVEPMTPLFRTSR